MALDVKAELEDQARGSDLAASIISGMIEDVQDPHMIALALNHALARMIVTQVPLEDRADAVRATGAQLEVLVRSYYPQVFGD